MGKYDIIINDLGVLNLLDQCSNLQPHLGRQLIYIPARCPWNEITEHEVGFLARRKVEKIFYQTNLNYLPTVKFFKSLGVDGVDVDWIPDCFKNYNFLVKNGIQLSLHLNHIPVTVTRKCHTARFLGEERPENCSKPCYRRTFALKNDILGMEFILQGNTVFQSVKPTKNEVKQISRKVRELVIAMNQYTKIENKESVSSLLRELNISGSK
jgi:hypothetical protein